MTSQPHPPPSPPPSLLERTRRRLGEERPGIGALPGSWIEAATQGRWEAAVVHLITAWTPVTLLVWLTGVGLLLTVLAGILLGSVTPAGAVLVGIPLVVLPALADNRGVLLSTATTGLIVGVISALVLTRVSIAFEPALIRLRGGRVMSDREAQRLMPLFDEVRRRMGLSSGPRLMIEDGQQPSAHTLTSTILLSRALIASMPDTQLSAVLAHELAHWSRGDAIADRFLLFCAFPLAMVHRLFVSLLQQRGLVTLVAWVFFWPAAITVRFVLEPVTARGRREREFVADAAAIRVGLAQGMYDALNQLGAVDLEGARTGWDLAMLHSHPPTELRLDAIHNAAPEVREAPYV